MKEPKFDFRKITSRYRNSKFAIDVFDLEECAVFYGPEGMQISLEFTKESLIKFINFVNNKIPKKLLEETK